MVEKAGSNGGISVGFYACTIWPQIKVLKLKRLCYNFCLTSVIRLLDYNSIEAVGIKSAILKSSICRYFKSQMKCISFDSSQ